MRIPINTITFLIIVIGLCFLQYRLSKCEVRWPGLVLPVICFIVSFIYPLNVTLTADLSFASAVGLMLMTWLIANIPTALFLVIYFAARESKRRKKQLDKMNIQDLD